MSSPAVIDGLGDAAHSTIVLLWHVRRASSLLSLSLSFHTYEKVLLTVNMNPTQKASQFHPLVTNFSSVR